MLSILSKKHSAIMQAIGWRKLPSMCATSASSLTVLLQQKIILIVRNPKDTIASLKRRYGSLSKSIRRWKSDNTKVLYWSSHPQCIAIQYEKLITDTGPTMTQVMEFLGKTFEPEQLNFHSRQVIWYQASENPPLDTAGASFGEQGSLTRTDIQTKSKPPTPEAIDESQYGSGLHHNTYRNLMIYYHFS